MIYLMGKSSTGKDTVYRCLLSWKEGNLRRIVPYTTRPIRLGEEDGKEYHFTDDTGYEDLEAKGSVIEARAYHTYHGIWRYFTVDDGKINLDHENYLIIGTLESYVKTVQYFGKEKVIPVLLELDDGVRLQRALNRERKQEHPRYEELCRRYLADAKDFSEENLEKAGVTSRFDNHNLKKCLDEIIVFIKQNGHKHAFCDK